MTTLFGAGLRDRARWIRIAILVGFAGSVAMAVASYGVGAVVLTRHEIPVELGGILRHRWYGTAQHRTGVRLVYFAGLGLMTAAFLYLGRLVLGRHPSLTWRTLRVAGLAWTVPLLASVPLGSRDLWAYLGQGNVFAHHLNPYLRGPIAVPGAYLQQIDPKWAHAGAPYGPLFVTIARLVVTVSGAHPLIAAIVLRSLCAAGFVVTVVALAPLCRRLGARTEIAMWLVATNPLFLVLAVSGGHNDLLALGLVAAGLWFATNPGSVWTTLVPAAALLTASAEIKAPAAVVLAFVPFIWLAYAPAGAEFRRRAHPRTRSLALTGATAVVTGGLVIVVTGLGFGWVSRLNAVASGAPLLSVPKALALIGKYFKGDHGRALSNLGSSTPEVGALALALAAATLAVVWALAWRGRRVMGLTTVALSSALLFSTTVQPWYFCWTIALAVLLTLADAVWEAIAVGCVALTFTVQPAGTAVLNLPVGVPLILVVGAASLTLLRLRRTTIQTVRLRIRPRVVESR